MGNYNLSSRAQNDFVEIYKYGSKIFGAVPAAEYLAEIEDFLMELAERPQLAREASTVSNGLKFYNFKAHVIFYTFDSLNTIFIVRILGKRMNFVEHL